MITIMDSIKETRNRVHKSLDPQLWHACAGGMVQMPPVNSKVFYFPQGHAEHARGHVDFGNLRVPVLIPCRVSAIQYLADPETDEVYAKTKLTPIRDYSYLNDNNGVVDDNEFDGVIENQEKPASFAKTLTQSDANNGGGFSVPRYCAETIFPRLDYNAEPPVQTILAKDVHGETWKFRHIYRGTPRRHLLTTGWSNFVNQKKLVAGDSIVFLRADNGDLCVGIRRAKRGIGSGYECPVGWNSTSGTGGSPFGGYASMFMRDDEINNNINKSARKNSNGDLRGKVRVESVIEAATLAANGKPFEVVYYPRASTPEFCVKASAVKAAMQIQWCSGMRFKMAFETEDSSRISWFMGTISSVQVVDHIHWPSSPWRLLQVAWDEPDLLQNVKRVNPWLVELVSNMPSIHLSPFSPPRKKLRLPDHPDFSFMNQFPMPSFTGNPFRSNNSPLCSNNIPTCIQGARHAQFGPSSDIHYNKLQLGTFPVGFEQTKAYEIPSGNHYGKTENSSDGISCLLTMGNSSQFSKEKNEMKRKTPHIFLFGKLILTEQQTCESSSGDNTMENPEKMVSDGSGSASLHNNGVMDTSSDEGSPWYKDHQKADTAHCKVFMESDILSNVIFRDAAGSVKHNGDEPFSEFMKAAARRLTVVADSSCDNILN